MPIKLANTGLEISKLPRKIYIIIVVQKIEYEFL
jgi:hypothetical protein